MHWNSPGRGEPSPFQGCSLPQKIRLGMINILISIAIVVGATQILVGLAKVIQGVSLYIAATALQIIVGAVECIVIGIIGAAELAVKGGSKSSR